MKCFMILAGFLFLFSVYVYGQTNVKDSLLTVLKNAKEDTFKVKTLLAYADAIENNEPVESARYARMAETLSTKLSYNEGLYRSLTNLSQTYYIRGLYDSSIVFLNSALQVAQKMNDKIKIGSTQLNLCTSHREKGDFEKAMGYCIEGRKILDDTNDDLLKAKMDDVLQILYNSRTSYEKAIEHGESALKTARKFKDEMFLVQCLVNLSMNYIAMRRYAEGEKLLNESLTIARKRGDKRVEAAAVMNLADMALTRRDPVKLKKLHKAEFEP